MGLALLCAPLLGCSAAPPANHLTRGYDIGVAQVAPFGRILVDMQGRTLYIYKPDHQTASTCLGACAVVWPPLLLSGPESDKSLGPGVDPTLVGSVRDSDGSVQLTYEKWPLYTFRFDKSAGATTGQGDDNDIWQVIRPNGEPISASS